MAIIGACFKGSKTDKNGNTYFIIPPEKSLLPIVIDDKKLLCFKMNPNPKTDKSPKWILDMFIPEDIQNEKSEQEKIQEAENKTRNSEETYIDEISF